MTVEELLSESVEDARVREQSAFDKIAGPARDKIVLFGAGMLGRKVARVLKSHGIIPLAFADNNPAIQGTKVEEIKVLSPSAAAARWREDAIFVVTIFRSGGDEGMSTRIRSLLELGCKRATSFLPLAWQFSSMLPHFAVALPSEILAYAESLKKVNMAWADETSRRVFAEQLTWRLHGDFSALPTPSPDQYFAKDILSPNPEEVFIDCGAFDGDTLRAIPWTYRRAWAFEPDPRTAAILRRSVSSNVTVCEVAVGKESGHVRFNAEGTIGSARSEHGLLEVRVAVIDELLTHESPTFIKLDIEGDELAALEGARATLARTQPVVAVCVYHRPHDLLQLPLHLSDMLSEHHLYLRSHANDGFELVTYAIPETRFCIKRLRQPPTVSHV